MVRANADHLAGGSRRRAPHRALVRRWAADRDRPVDVPPAPWSPFVSGDWGIGLPRHGASRRRAHGTEQIVDTNTGFFLRLGEEVEVAHFTGRTDEITFVDIDPDADDCLADLAAASGPIRITPDMTLTHRRLLRALRHSGVPLAIETIVVDLLTAGLLSISRPCEPRPAGQRSRSDNDS
jgi:hypothetical protein